MTAEWATANIVAVDDDPDQLLLLERLLGGAGYRHVQTTHDPRELLDRFEELRPDMILLDLRMPGMDGFDVLERLGDEIGGDDYVPVIVLTAAQNDGSRRRALKLGAKDFVRKPFDRTEVLLRIRNHLRTRSRHLELRERSAELAREVEARGADLELFHEVLETIDDAVIIEDPGTGEVVYRNAAMRGAERAVDLDGNQWGDGGLDDVSSTKLPGGLEAFEGILNHQDGTDTPVDVVVQTVRHRGRELLVGLCRDVSQRKAAERTLADAVEREREAAGELRRLNDLKNLLLSAVNHELRTPLTLIRGIAQTFQDRRLTTDVVERLTPVLDRQTSQLQNLLDDLLDLDHLNRGQLLFEPRESDLSELVRAVIDEAALDDHELTLDLPHVEAVVDRGKFQRIASNLLRNAARHTPAGSRVEVVLRGGEHVRLSVIDDGEGVPDELKERIFEPFEQGDPASPHQHGTGVGLSLVRTFAELHGGSAWVEDAPSGGAAFHVELPSRPRRHLSLVSPHPGGRTTRRSG